MPGPRCVADPKGNTGLFLSQLVTAVCGCFCLTLAIICFCLTQSPLPAWDIPTINTAPYEGDVHNIYFQEPLIVNGAVSQSSPGRFSLWPNLVNATESVVSLRVCFSVRGTNSTGDIQAVVPYPDYQSDGGLIIPMCPESGIVAEMPSIPLCAEVGVYVDVNSTSTSEENFSLFFYIDSCIPSDPCTCDSLWYLFDGFIVAVLVLFVSVVGLIILCCCGCCWGWGCWSTCIFLSIVSYQQSGPQYEPVLHSNYNSNFNYKTEL